MCKDTKNNKVCIKLEDPKETIRVFAKKIAEENADALNNIIIKPYIKLENPEDTIQIFMDHNTDNHPIEVKMLKSRQPKEGDEVFEYNKKLF